jgi:hypothetical protein
MNPQNMNSPNPAEEIFMTGPEGLARILTMDETGTDLWGAEEMQAIWLHQLSAPLDTDLSLVESGRAKEFGKSGETKPFLAKTFRDLLEHPHPPLRLLNLIEDFAKQAARDSDDAQLRQVATALYYASYAARLTRCDNRTGALNAAELKAGFDWALSRLWLDEPTKKLIHEACESMPKKPSF